MAAAGESLLENEVEEKEKENENDERQGETSEEDLHMSDRSASAR